MTNSTSDSSKYKMTLSLNVLNHLGINLYSNIPSVISEAVANAWDADAKEVKISVDQKTNTIEIADDGNGMSFDEINDKFLTVGYRKRENNEGVSSIFKRAVMGRKGIGKLSLFSIAKEIRVYSTKGGNKEALLLSLEEIKTQIQTESGTYFPQRLTDFPNELKKGTIIVLNDLKKRNIPS